MKIIIKQLFADIKKIRDSLPQNNPQWIALNDIIIDLSFFPDNSEIIVADKPEEQKKETKDN